MQSEKIRNRMAKKLTIYAVLFIIGLILADALYFSMLTHIKLTSTDIPSEYVVICSSCEHYKRSNLSDHTIINEGKYHRRENLSTLQDWVNQGEIPIWYQGYIDAGCVHLV